MAITQLRKALTTAAGSGEDLLPYDLDPMLHEELLVLQPLTQLLSVLPAGGLTHEYRVRTSHPAAWFEGEVTPANNKKSGYTRKTVQTKIQRIWGSVAGFAQAATAKFVNALATEVEGSLMGMADLFEYGALFGTADDIGFTGDAYQYSGILPRIFSYAPGNVIDAGGDKISLDDLDAAIALIDQWREVKNDPQLFMMSVRMRQVVDGLQTRVQIPLTNVELGDGKIRMRAYDDRPIYESNYFKPAATTSSPTVDGAPAAGGALPDASWTYRIASVTAYGEQVAGTASAADVTATTNNSVDLTWTADPLAYEYMIFRSQDGGAYQLLDIIPAFTYDSAGTVNGSVEAYSDEGAKTPKAIKPLEAGEQNILLLDTNPERGAAFVGLVDDMGDAVDQMVRFVELARTGDTYDYFLKSYLALRFVHPNLGAVIRHAKLA